MINYCIKNNIDVQPHKFFFCEAFNKLYNRNNNKIPFKNINITIKKNNKFYYLIDSINEQTDLCKICDDNVNNVNINSDFYRCLECNSDENLNINKDINFLLERASSNLESYMINWEKKFNIKARVFSCHGDGGLNSLTKLLNPNYFACIEKIENKILNANSYNYYLNKESKFKLAYKNDNSLNKEFIISNIHNNITQYQLLIHPYVWSN